MSTVGTLPGLTMDSGSSIPVGSKVTFGSGSPITAIPQTSQNVLGASTSSGGGSGGTVKQNGGWYDGVQYWDPGQGPQSGGGSGGAGTPDQNALIDQAFSGEMNFLNGLPEQLVGARDDAYKAADTQYTGQQKNITNQLGQLNSQLGIDTNNWNQNMNSAFSQAQNSYNQLLQRNLSLYGGQGAGAALNAILGQGYLQSNGELMNNNTQGQMQLGLQGQNINQWGDTQNNQLDIWHNQAHTLALNTYNQGIDAVNQQKGLTEDAKAQAKLGLLTDYINNKQQLDNYKSQLQLYQQTFGSTGASDMGLNNFNPGNYVNSMQNANAGVQNSKTAFAIPFNAGQQQQAPQYQAPGYAPMLTGSNLDSKDAWPSGQLTQK